jgi:hypothetical protein
MEALARSARDLGLALDEGRDLAQDGRSRTDDEQE